MLIVVLKSRKEISEISGSYGDLYEDDRLLIALMVETVSTLKCRTVSARPHSSASKTTGTFETKLVSCTCQSISYWRNSFLRNLCAVSACGMDVTVTCSNEALGCFIQDMCGAMAERLQERTLD
jgi:hypothetical protein